MSSAEGQQRRERASECEYAIIVMLPFCSLFIVHSSQSNPGQKCNNKMCKYFGSP